MQIAVVDLGVGNLRSVAQAVRAVSNINVVVTSQANVIESSDKVILPGQGAVGAWFKALDSRGVGPAVLAALHEKPVLGICVGMQALFEFCEEDGGREGLGLFKGEVRHFHHFHPAQSERRISIPQMGWNTVQHAKQHPLWQGIENHSHFYFLHSFCANVPETSDHDVVGLTNYHHEYIAAVARDNIFASQFHPEKSHNDGLQLMRNFCAWDGQP